MIIFNTDEVPFRFYLEEIYLEPLRLYPIKQNYQKPICGSMIGTDKRIYEET